MLKEVGIEDCIVFMYCLEYWKNWMPKETQQHNQHTG